MLIVHGVFPPIAECIYAFLNYYASKIPKGKEFWDCFYGAFEQNRGLSEVGKFNYLKAKFELAANAAIYRIEITWDTYGVVWSKLNEMCRAEEIVNEAHYNRLMAIPTSVMKS